jgi:hypothetical protein
MHNMEWISMDETLKNQHYETLDLYTRVENLHQLVSC